MAMGDKPGTKRLAIRNLPLRWHTAAEVDATMAGKTKEEFCRDILMNYMQRTMEKLDQVIKKT